MMKRVLFLLLLILAIRASAQVTPNIGFDDGTFDHWRCWVGTVRGGLSLTEVAYPANGRHTMVTNKAYIDPFGKFPMLCPNGSGHSIMLGNTSTGGQAERVSYDFTMPASGNYTIVFDYAVVLQDPGHASDQQPKFTAAVYNVTDGVYLDCPSFNFIAGAGLPGFELSKLSNVDIYYKPWAKATIDIRGVPNKVIRLEFTTMDCAPGAHFGYAYLDVENNDLTELITGNAYCKNQNEVNLLGPAGFQVYTWYNADKTKILGYDRSLRISPGPPNNTSYVLHVEPYLGLGCPSDITTVVNKIDADFDLQVHDVKTCPGTPGDITSPDAVAGSVALKYKEYFTDAAAQNELISPSAVDPGTYYIRGISADGCTEMKPINVGFYNKPQLTIVSDPAPVTYPNSVDLSTAFAAIPGYTYEYKAGADVKQPLTDYKNVTTSGTYIIKAISPDGCDTSRTVRAVINPPPAVVSTSPNTFTPNGDGINDHFSFSANGFYHFTQLRIYSRNGQLLFTTKSQDQYWDGTYNGRALPAGVYYWVFDGIDDYSKGPISRGGSIAIIR